MSFQTNLKNWPHDTKWLPVYMVKSQKLLFFSLTRELIMGSPWNLACKFIWCLSAKLYSRFHKFYLELEILMNWRYSWSGNHELEISVYHFFQKMVVKGHYTFGKAKNLYFSKYKNRRQTQDLSELTKGFDLGWAKVAINSFFFPINPFPTHQSKESKHWHQDGVQLRI